MWHELAVLSFSYNSELFPTLTQSPGQKGNGAPSRGKIGRGMPMTTTTTHHHLAKRLKKKEELYLHLLIYAFVTLKGELYLIIIIIIPTWRKFLRNRL